MDESTIRGVNDVTTFVAAHFEAERAEGGALHQALSAHLKVGLRLEARAGQEQLASTRTAVDEQFAVALRGLDAVTGLLAARSISPRIWASLENGDLVQPAVRSILELAVKKYGTWANVPRDLEELPAFAPADLAAIARAFVLAEGYAALLAVERRVCKGQAQTVTRVAPFDCVIDEGCQLDRLIDLLDSRCEREADPLGQYGTVTRDLDHMPVPFLLGARWVLPSEVLDDRGVFTIERVERGEMIPTADRVSRWGCGS